MKQKLVTNFAKVKPAIIVIVLYILFHKLFELLANKTIVKYLFSTVESTWYNDVIFFAIIFVTLIFFNKKVKAYVPSLNILIILCSCSMIYMYYRILNVEWVYRPFFLFQKIKYADVLLVITLINILLFMFGIEASEQISTRPKFFEDISVGEILPDELGYSNYASNLSNKIMTSNFKKSFAIGINGKWGLGKTSFIDLLKRELPKENVIQIEFNPWNSYTPQAIIKDFFDTVQASIRPYHSSLATLLAKYADKLVAINDSNLSKSIQFSVSLITGYDSLNSIFLNINKSLKDINKKLVIYIDDLDRLDKDEIIEVIRLIRNTANFYNTVFVVAYDKNYIIKALENHNSYSHEQFLEKIFQLEVTLPSFKKDILKYKLSQNLKFNFPENYHKAIEEAVMGSSSISSPYLDNWLETMRDVTRLTNSITLNLVDLIGEVDIEDFIKIETLRLKYPSAYELIFKKRHLFLKASGDQVSNFKYQLSDAQNIKEIKEEEKRQIYLKIYLRKNHRDLGIRESEIEKIIDLLESLFSSSLNYQYYRRPILSISYVNKFARYFSYGLSESDLSEIDFNQARSLDLSSFTEKISDWISQGLTRVVQGRFMEIKSYYNKQDFEKIIKAIFFLANLPNTNDHYPLKVGYDGKDLYDKLGDYNGRIVNQFYDYLGGKDELHSFIKGLFENTTAPYSFESEFARYINSVYFDETVFPLSKDELKGISIGYLRSYCESIDKLDRNVFFLLWSTEQTNYIPSGGNSFQSTKEIPDEAKDIFKSFVLKDFDQFLFWIIEVDPFRLKSFTVVNTIVVIYNSWANFKTVLLAEDENKWKYLAEFKSFFEQAEKVNFAQYVPFAFEIIPIESKIKAMQQGTHLIS
jgi:KAP-like P-loop domain-containing protein